MLLSDFTNIEKTFLAGCIKSIILADGKIEDEELADLQEILGDLNFSDYEVHLKNFEDQVKDEETFWAMSESMDREEAKDSILSIIYELSLQEGYQAETSKILINKIKESWNMT